MRCETADSILINVLPAPLMSVVRIHSVVTATICTNGGCCVVGTLRAYLG